MPAPQSQPTHHAERTLASNVVQRAMSDLEAAWADGPGISLEQYYDKHPELGPVQNVPAVLVYHEYCLRQKYGDAPPLETYKQRFPHLYDLLVTMVRQPLPETTPPPPAADVPSERMPSVPSVLGPSVSAPPPPTTGATSTQLTGGGYRLIEILGSGSFADVWRGEAPGGIAVAIKVVRQAMEADEAKRELQALELTKNLKHPFLLQTHSVWVQENRLHIVMELAEMSLRQRLKTAKQQGNSAIALVDLLGYMHESAEGLDFLRKHRVYHRDVKPDNILLLEGHAKVADFGLARLGSGQSMRLLEASYAGTPLYMAPEVFRNRVSPNSDQYSLASTYFELRTGMQLFRADNLHELILKHLEEDPDLKSLPQAEADVLNRALAKDPSTRFGSCLEFVDALETGVSASLPRHSRRSSPATARMLASLHGGANSMGATDPSATAAPPLLEAPRRRNTLLTAVAFVGLAVLVGLGGFLLTRDSKPDILPTSPTLANVTKPSEPEPIRIWLPERCVMADGAKEVAVGNKKMYDRVFLTPENTNVKIPFRLIPQEKGSRLAPYYIMETKVWNDLFRQFAKEYPADVKESKWENGPDPNPDGSKYKDGKLPGDWPVVNVTWNEAFEFAKWLGGRLPTPEQWNRAAGCYDGGGGPIAGGTETLPTRDEVAFGRTGGEGNPDGPLPVGKATRDFNPRTGCRDMAGNGKEWTRTKKSPNIGELDCPPPRGADVRVITCGRSFEYPKPLIFKNRDDYDEEESGPNPAQPFDTPKYELSFRVVLDDLSPP